MYEIIKALILGIIQGLTEFLPVSSSGHLEIANYILGNEGALQSNILMTVVLHFATALATFIVFRKEVADLFSNALRKDRASLRYLMYIIVSMIPAGIIGLLFDKQIEALFSSNILLVSIMLIFTGVLLLIADYAKDRGLVLSYKNTFLIGVAQAIAILPGVSRSGATISTSILLGIDRTTSTRFSFLMVIPLIFGKMFLDLLQGDFTGADVQLIPLIVGFSAAFISGYAACIWMLKLVKNAKLRYFAIYCFIIALIGVTYLWMK